MANGVATETFKMLIAGEMVDSPSTFPVINPATGEVFAHAPDCSRAQLEKAMHAAKAAFPAWAADSELRAETFMACAAALREHMQELATVLTMEQGKPLSHAMYEVMASADRFERMAHERIAPETVFEDAEKKVIVYHRPLGVVVGITPWNFPLLMAASKILPALAVGNTMVLKPSPYTPLSTLKLGEILQKKLPPGVLNIISGGDQLGKQMTEHPIPRKISFTGSVGTGKKIAASAAPDLKRLTLELGGNDPAIVLDDVNPAQVAQALFWNAFMNSGQVCIAIKRLFVPKTMYKEMTNQLAAIAKGVRMGSGLDPETQLGPINNKMQYERVQELLRDARAKGGKFLAGGEIMAGGGYFITPAIITDVGPGVRIVDEEQFGPALPVIPYNTVEEALEMANATNFGLGGSVWGKNVELANEVAQQVESGTVWVNKHMDLIPEAPFGGVKWSGLGRQNGRWDLEAHTEPQVINISKIELS